MHDMCGAGEQGEGEQQEGWAEKQKGGGENTCDCDSESHSNQWSRAEARETCSHDESKVGWEREVEAERQGGKLKGDGQHCTPGGEPLLGWKHGVRLKGAQDVKEVERQRASHAMNLSLESLGLKGQPTDKRDELLTTLAW